MDPFPSPPAQTTTVAKPKKPWTKWRIFRWTFSILVLAFLGWIGFLLCLRQYTFAKNKKLLADAISETDRIDPRWRWEEINSDREPIPEELNSARILEEILKSFPKQNGFLDERLDAKRADGETLLDAVESNRLPDAEDRILLNRVLEQERMALNRVHHLVDFPQGRFQSQLTNNPLETRLDYTYTRYVFKLLSLKAEARLLHNDPDESLRCVRAILNSADALRDEYSLVPQLVRIAGRSIAVSRTNRILAIGTPKHELAEVQAHFDRESKEDIFRPMVRGERAKDNVIFEKMEAGKLTIHELSEIERGTSMRTPPDRWDEFIQWRYDPYVYNNHAIYLRWCNQFLAINDLPWGARQRAADAIPDIPLEFETVLAHLLQAHFSRSLAAVYRDQASLRCAVVGIACERYRQRNGHWPATLEIIPPDLLPELPTDPYDGHPLCYKHLDDGVVVYSVGRNTIDDGGKLKAKNMTSDKPHDIGFRLWNPDRRGLPPIEKRELLPLPKASAEQ